MGNQTRQETAYLSEDQRDELCDRVKNWTQRRKQNWRDSECQPNATTIQP